MLRRQMAFDRLAIDQYRERPRPARDARAAGQPRPGLHGDGVGRAGGGAVAYPRRQHRAADALGLPPEPRGLAGHVRLRRLVHRHRHRQRHPRHPAAAHHRARARHGAGRPARPRPDGLPAAGQADLQRAASGRPAGARRACPARRLAEGTLSPRPVLHGGGACPGHGVPGAARRTCRPHPARAAMGRGADPGTADGNGLRLAISLPSSPIRCWLRSAVSGTRWSAA